VRRDRYDTRGHYDLDAWKVARDLVKAIYLLTQSFHEPLSAAADRPSQSGFDALTRLTPDP